MSEKPDTLIERLSPELVTAPLYSEDSLALQFTDRHQNDLRFTAELGKYHRLSRTLAGGVVWEKDTILRTFSEVRDLIREESMLAPSPAKQNRLCSAATVSAVEKLVRCDSRTAMTVDMWDAEDMVINTPSGVVDLENGKTLPGDPLRYCTKVTSCGPSSTRPELWLRCLQTWTNNDEGLQQYLQRICGYSLSGSTEEHKFWFVYGSAATGKSVFLRTISGILNTYAKSAPPEVVAQPKIGDKHPTGMASLVGARLALASELESGARWSETQIKVLAGEDTIPTRFMRGDFFEFKAKCKLFVSGNHKPLLSAFDQGIARRLNLVPFESIIPPEKRDTKLFEKLRREWPGIMGWMIQGCLLWQKDGLQSPACVTAATTGYLEDQDVLGSWLQERCVMGPNYRAKSGSLYGDWKNWSEANNQFTGSQRHFLNSLQERPGILSKHTNTGNYMLGIGLEQDGGYE